jgi:hypothetical protein
MTHPSRSEAQQRADEIRVFRTELSRLEAEGALQLSALQMQALTVHQDRLLANFAAAFDIDRDIKAHQLSLGMRLASFLGALALAASVFFFFYQFWGAFGETGHQHSLVYCKKPGQAGLIWLRAMKHSVAVGNDPHVAAFPEPSARAFAAPLKRRRPPLLTNCRNRSSQFQKAS